VFTLNILGISGTAGGVPAPPCTWESKKVLKAFPLMTASVAPSPVYAPATFNYQRGEIGKIYPPTSGDFIAMAPIDLGNTKGEDKFNISLGTLNPPDQTDSPTRPII